MKPDDHDILIRLDENVKGIHRMLEPLTQDHENRIRKLEAHTNRFLGRQSIMGALIGGTISVVIEAFRIIKGV